MEGDHVKIKEWLIPLSWIYGFGVSIRNFLFDCNILKSQSFKTPVISLGNLTIGGTGKTPHTEYIVNLLHKKKNVAVLSRGYKRKTKNFIIANSKSTHEEIGDEPLQMQQKFPDITVAVDRNRVNGINRLTSETVNPPIDVIILDDAYQHRYVQPGLNILLMDYHRLVYYDRLLPAGNLREPARSLYRADIVIVTKCPHYMTPMDRRGIEHSLDLQPWQKIFFSTFSYGEPYKLTLGKNGQADMSLKEIGSNRFTLLTGIASPEQMKYDLEKITNGFDVISYPDHHNYTASDIQSIAERSNGQIILTTEKDASRLASHLTTDLPKELAERIYILPVKVEIMNGKAEEFDNLVISYVNKNSRTSTLNS